MKNDDILVWAIAHWNGGIYADTIRRTRKEAVEAFVQQFVRRGESWKSESRFGINRAVRIRVAIWKGHGQ